MVIRFEDDVYIRGRKTRSCTIEDGETVWCTVDGTSYRVAMEDGVLSAEGMAAEHWGDVTILTHTERVCPRCVRQTVQTVDGVHYAVTASCESERTVVWIDRETDARMYLLPRGEDAEITLSASLLAVAVAVKRGGAHYLALLPLGGDAALYEGWVDEYRLDDRLEVVCTIDDMKRHIRRTVYGYDGMDFCIRAQSFTCANAHTYISALYPYLFCEALAAGDEEEAKTYLAEDLARDWEALRAYMGGVCAVRRPPLPCADNEVGVADAEGVGKIFSFEMAGDRINDVKRIS